MHFQFSHHVLCSENYRVSLISWQYAFVLLLLDKTSLSLAFFNPKDTFFEKPNIIKDFWLQMHTGAKVDFCSKIFWNYLNFCFKNIWTLAPKIYILTKLKLWTLWTKSGFLVPVCVPMMRNSNKEFVPKFHKIEVSRFLSKVKEFSFYYW